MPRSSSSCSSVAVNAASAACWDGVAALDVMWLWSAEILEAMSGFVYEYPIRHPVMAYAFDAPLMTTVRSRSSPGRSRTPGARSAI